MIKVKIPTIVSGIDIINPPTIPREKVKISMNSIKLGIKSIMNLLALPNGRAHILPGGLLL
jgi:hypothetical protein